MRARSWDDCHIFQQIFVGRTSQIRVARYVFVVVQSLSHIQLCDPVNCSTPGFSVLHSLQEFVFKLMSVESVLSIAKVYALKKLSPICIIIELII